MGGGALAGGPLTGDHVRGAPGHQEGPPAGRVESIDEDLGVHLARGRVGGAKMVDSLEWAERPRPRAGGRGVGPVPAGRCGSARARAPPGWSARAPLEAARAMNSPGATCSVLAGGTARGAVVVRLHAVHLQR